MGKNEGCSRDFYIAQHALCGTMHALWKARLQNGNCCSRNTIPAYTRSNKQHEKGWDYRMTWLRGFLAAHQLMLALLQGQAFFTLGLSITFLARRSARLEVARGLAPLAAFGFCEALVAWSPIMLASPISAAPLLAWLRLLLLGVGYAFLLAFALQTQAPPNKRQEKWWAFAGGLFALWLTGLTAWPVCHRSKCGLAARSPPATGWRCSGGW